MDSLDGETNDLRTKLHLTQTQLSLAEQDVNSILEREERHETEIELAQEVTKDLEERLVARCSRLVLQLINRGHEDRASLCS